MVSIEKRIDEVSYVDKPIYINGLVRICRFLIEDLSYYLEQEGRRFGIVLKYFNTIDDNFLYIPEPIDELGIYNKISFLIKPLILTEFKKLQKRKVTEADAVIIILSKLLPFILEVDTDEEYEYTDYVKEINRIVQLLFDNIKNRNKKCQLVPLISSLRHYVNCGVVGRVESVYFSLRERSLYRSKLDSPDVLLKSDCEGEEIVF